MPVVLHSHLAEANLLFADPPDEFPHPYIDAHVDINHLWYPGTNELKYCFQEGVAHLGNCDQTPEH